MNSICKIKDIYKALYQFEKSFAEEYGISINEGVILCCLKDADSKLATELCEYIGLSNSRGSRILHTLETKEIIQREIGAKDKRQMVFTLTPKGRAKIAEMQKKKLDFSEFKTHLSSLMVE